MWSKLGARRNLRYPGYAPAEVDATQEPTRSDAGGLHSMPRKLYLPGQTIGQRVCVHVR
jgi:hypothetical protein